MDSEKSNREIRFWYSGQSAPPAELAGVAEAISVRKEVLFSQGEERRSGSYTEVIEAIEKGMQALQRNAFPVAADSVESRMSQFAKVLVESTQAAAEQVQVLKQLGAFRFRKADSAEEKKQKLSGALEDLASGEAGSAGKLWQLWQPEQKSLLDSIINRPSEVGRVVGRRVKQGRDGKHLEVVAHRFENADPETLQPFIDSQAVAYHEGGSTICLLGGVGEYLGVSAGEGASNEFTNLQVLLLHEIVAGMLQETGLDDLAAHVVATVVVRSLAKTGLQAAVESYCLELKRRSVDGDLMAIEAELDGSNAGVTGSESDEEEFWADCIVTHGELRSEAFEVRSTTEQNMILKAMFGEDWNEEDEAAVEDLELASV